MYIRLPVDLLVVKIENDNFSIQTFFTTGFNNTVFEKKTAFGTLNEPKWNKIHKENW